MPGEKGGRSIFIGNIPYGLSEEQIIDLCRQAGPVNSFRLVHDKETAKPKGFGFAEFRDADAAASAVRNLNGHEIMGRTLRVDYSNESGSGDTTQTEQNQVNGTDTASVAIGAPGLGQGSLPNVPQGTDLPPNVSAPDAISRTLSTLPPPQLLDILSQMKGVAMSDPIKAAELFRSNPQLSYAMFQALLLLGLVDATVLTNVIGSAQAQPPPPQTQAIPPSLPQQLGYPPQFAAQPHLPPNVNVLSPSVPPQMPGVPTLPMTTDLNALKQQVMALPQHDIDAMPPPTRAQIMDLKQRIIMGQL